MAWDNLRSEIVDMFAELVRYVPDENGTIFFRRSPREPKPPRERSKRRKMTAQERSAKNVARVARWREKNRERRNATARAAYARKKTRTQ